MKIVGIGRGNVGEAFPSLAEEANSSAGSQPKRGRPGYGHPWLTLVAVASGIVMAGLDATVVNIANPAIARDLHSGLTGLQWVTNGYLLALAASLIIAGRLADRIGYKLVFVVGVIAFACSSLLVGLSSSIALVVLWRVVQGFAGAMLQPASLAILRKSFPAEKLNMAIGIWGGVSALSIASGPVVGGLVVQSLDWRSVFFLNVPIGLITLAFAIYVIKESRDPDARGSSFDLPGMVLLAGTLFALVWGLINAQSYGFDNALPLSLLAAAVLLGVLFVYREHRAPQPLLPLSLFRSVSLSTGAILLTLGTTALLGSFFFITLYLQQVQGLSPIEAGVRLLPLTAVFMVASPLGGAVAGRLGARWTLVVGMLLNALAQFGMSRLSADSPYSHLWPWFAVLGLGFAFVVVAGTQAIISNAPVELAGTAGGLQQTGAQLGGVLGITVLGTIMTARVSDVLVGKLTSAGVPMPLANQLAKAKDVVAQGGAPVPPGGPDAAAHAITIGSHLAFMSGLRTALIVAAIVDLAGAFAALAVRPGQPAGPGAAD